MDNEPITDLVVETLKSMKRKGQVVAVTHNANVVDTADSENVVILRHGGTPVIAEEGAIQQPEVKDATCRIMEGGERAFQERHQRLVG